MPTDIKLWDLASGHPQEVPNASLADSHYERELENWIAENPSLLGEDFLVIGRQCQTIAGPLDLLLLTRDGQLVVAELKRDLSARETVAQALDYASWVDSLEDQTVFEIAAEFLKRPLDEAFEERFHVEVPAIDPQNHRILIVASRLDAGAERIVNYLSERHHVNMNAILFKYVRMNGGHELLARTVLVPDDIVRERSTAGRTRRPGMRELMELSDQRRNQELVKPFEDPEEDCWEVRNSGTFGGSLRCFRQGKMIFGLNVSGKGWSSPEGVLDVWVRTPTVSELTGIQDTQIRSSLEKYEVVDKEVGGTGTVIRLRDSRQAEKLAADLRQWISCGKKN